MISTLNVQLLVQEQTKKEVDDKISIASQIARVPKETVTQVYSLIFILFAQVEIMYTDNAKIIDKKYIEGPQVLPRATVDPMSFREWECLAVL